MGLAGVSGPFRGAYDTVCFATPAIGANTGNLGTNKSVMWRWSPITDIVVPADGIQLYIGNIGTNTRVNIEANGSSILSNTVNSAASMGVGLTSGNFVTATLTDGVGFGNLGSDVVPTKGTFIKAGTLIQATASNGATVATALQGTICFYHVSHATSVRSTFE